MIGERFVRWTIIGYVDGKSWLCRCDCGFEAVRRKEHLASGGSRSCGCLQREEARARRLQHGLTKTPIYQVWGDMKKRCTNPNYKEWRFYGGRGIKVCDRWMTFANFYEDMGDLPFEKARLDRIDNDGNYELGNVRWATIAENNRNTRKNIMLTYNGETCCLFDMADKHNIPRKTLWARIRVYKWDTETALKTPTSNANKYKNLSTDSARSAA